MAAPTVCLPCYEVTVNNMHKIAVGKFPNLVCHKDMWDYRHCEFQLTCQKEKNLPEKETEHEVVELLSTSTLEVRQLRLQKVLQRD